MFQAFALFSNTTRTLDVENYEARSETLEVQLPPRLKAHSHLSLQRFILDESSKVTNVNCLSSSFLPVQSSKVKNKRNSFWMKGISLFSGKMMTHHDSTSSDNLNCLSVDVEPSLSDYHVHVHFFLHSLQQLVYLPAFL